MTIDQRLEALTRNSEIQHESIKRLEGVVSTLATTVVAHDNQIEQLIAVAEENKRQWQDLQRQWQAYLNTLPKN